MSDVEKKEKCPIVNGVTEHKGVKLDSFSRLPGVRRSVPGDCICATCREPIPYKWNDGHPFFVGEQQ